MYNNTQFSSYQSQGQPYSGPPPAKKSRGNGPIITRYPPPPGYRPPHQPQPLFVQQHGQQPGYGQPPYPGYQQPPQHIYQQYQQPPYLPTPQQPSYIPGPQQGWQQPITTPQSAPPLWQPPPNAMNHTARRHNSAPFPISGPLLDGNGDPMPPMDDVMLTGEELEHEFDGECYYSRHPEEINPELSLGVIEWTAPLPTRRALPATFGEAELEALAPRPPPAEGESISEYFTGLKRNEAFLSVRQTDAWQSIKDSLIFKEFAAVCSEVITLAEMLEKYRCRYDPKWAELDSFSARSATPDLIREATPADPADERWQMEMDETQASFGAARDRSEPASGILDDLEKALRPTSRGSIHHHRHSRTSSVTSQNLSRPKPLPPVRDQSQEDILAALGVTGSPKLVYQTPGPAFGPPPPAKSRNNSINSVGKLPGINLPPPSTNPGRQQSPSHDSSAPNGYRPGSAHSHRTANGSDFDAEPDEQITPRPKVPRNENRKRSYADSAAGVTLEPLYEDDEDTPRQRKQARVDDGHDSLWR